MQLITDIFHQKSDTLFTYLKNGGDPNRCEDALGVTLLHHAVYAKNYAALEMLIFWGANPYLPEKIFNMTPYDLAIDIAWIPGITLFTSNRNATKH